MKKAVEFHKRLFCLGIWLAVFLGMCSQVLAANIISLSLVESSDNLEIIATYNLDDHSVNGIGILMGNTDSELTMNTDNIRKIWFTEPDRNNTCTLSIPKNLVSADTQFRAFAASGENDNTYYSNQCSLSDSGDLIVGNVIYRRIEGGVEVAGVNMPVKSLVIPDSVQGYTVIKVGNQAFENDTVLTEIDLPDTIQCIGKRAFAGCTALRNMK